MTLSARAMVSFARAEVRARRSIYVALSRVEDDEDDE